jgi:hypothetical protein
MTKLLLLKPLACTHRPPTESIRQRLEQHPLMDSTVGMTPAPPEQQPQQRRLLDSTAGVVFYGTPHAGVPLTGLHSLLQTSANLHRWLPGGGNAAEAAAPEQLAAAARAAGAADAGASGQSVAGRVASAASAASAIASPAAMLLVDTASVAALKGLFARECIARAAAAATRAAFPAYPTSAASSAAEVAGTAEAAVAATSPAPASPTAHAPRAPVIVSVAEGRTTSIPGALGLAAHPPSSTGAAAGAQRSGAAVDRAGQRLADSSSIAATKLAPAALESTGAVTSGASAAASGPQLPEAAGMPTGGEVTPNVAAKPPADATGVPISGPPPARPSSRWGWLVPNAAAVRSVFPSASSALSSLSRAGLGSLGISVGSIGNVHAWLSFYVVPPESAAAGVGVYAVASGADHVEVCKPETPVVSDPAGSPDGAGDAPTARAPKTAQGHGEGSHATAPGAIDGTASAEAGSSRADDEAADFAAALSRAADLRYGAALFAVQRGLGEPGAPSTRR